MNAGDRPRFQAIQWLLAATLFWGLSFPVAKALLLLQHQLVPQGSTWFLSSLCVTVRFTAAALILSAWHHRTLGGLSGPEWRQGLGLGLFGGAALLLQMDGLAYIPASTSAFLTQLYSLIIPVFIAVTRRRWPPPVVALSCGLVLTGSAILAQFDWRQLRLGRGEAETILSSVLFSGQILWLERPAYRLNNMGHASCVMFAVIASLCLPVAGLTSPGLADWGTAYRSLPILGFQASLVLFCTLVAYLLMNYWQPHVTATEAGLIYCLEPVFASGYALFLPGWLSHWTGIDYADETLAPRLLIGGGLILVANVLLHHSHYRKSRPDSPPTVQSRL